MVEVFKTNITEEHIAAFILERLQKEIPEARISFDLEDCDKILRIESPAITIQHITKQVQKLGFYCEVLE